MANELDALDPQPAQVTLSTGTEVQIEQLRTRQFFKLLRIITRGALPSLQDMSLFKVDGDMDTSEFAGRLISLLLLSIPEAENETVEFVQAMCRPVGLVNRPGGRQNKQETAHNTALWTALISDLDNPKLDDLVTVIEAVVKQESGDLLALGKRLTSMFQMAEKTGQVPRSPSPTSTVGSFSAGSAAPLTYSVTNTGGETTTSGTFQFDDSASASPPSASAATSSATSSSNG